MDSVTEARVSAVLRDVAGQGVTVIVATHKTAMLPLLERLIVLQAGESKMFSLNGMGLWFWQHVERPITKRKLLVAMLAEYEVTEEAAAAEIDRFLAYLEEKKLAQRVDGRGE